MNQHTNCLKTVILKLDCLGAIPLSNELIENVKNSVGGAFPDVERKDRVSVEMDFDPSQKTTKEKRLHVFLLKNNSTNNSILLEPNAVTFEINTYDTYQKFKKYVEKVIMCIQVDNPDVKMSRIGLRYINQLKLNEGGPFDWEGVINSSLLSKIDFIQNNELARDVRLIQLTKSDYSVRFQFGFFNSEFPNPIAKKEFLLDYDCYTTTETEMSDVIQQIDTYHTTIKDLFNHSICDDLEV